MEIGYKRVTLLIVIAAMILLASLPLYISWRINKSRERDEHTVDVAEPTPQPVRQNNPYEGLRQTALNTTHEQLDLDLPAEQVRTYGVVIDVASAAGLATYVAFETGDASMYTSTGGGIIGGIGHEAVRGAARALVKTAGEQVSNLAPAEKTPLPDARRVKIYVLTNQGRYVAEDSTDNFFSPSGRNRALWTAANELLTELRIIDESKGNPR